MLHSWIIIPSSCKIAIGSFAIKFLVLYNRPSLHRILTAITKGRQLNCIMTRLTCACNVEVQTKTNQYINNFNFSFFRLGSISSYMSQQIGCLLIVWSFPFRFQTSTMKQNDYQPQKITVGYKYYYLLTLTVP